ncbi:tetratricopeptide repeat protein [Flavivirga spongiicola]|uniref:Tetratricopeptide repeat protein n=1 Tax=Flavivirga spongiicola TaxID=421621 RepID=A0ABU7XMT6_9FLAO|nr:hypothetical protein [Flavivirga sp. MEBiC05379]MDO5981734.1 hypothetical protein [Flavivirga sp. MEBiC05379]
MKKSYILIIFITFLNCKNDVYSDKDKLIITEEGNTSLLYKNSYENGIIKDSIAGLNFDKGIEESSRLNFKKAKEYYEYANQLDPNNITIINALGSVYNHLQNFQESNEQFEKAIKLDSTDSVTYLNYGFSKASNDEFTKAIDYYKKGVSYERSGERRAYFYYNISKAYYNLNSYEKAEFYIDKSIELVNNKIIRKEILNFKKEITEK